MMNPVAMSIIVNTFTDPKQRAQAIGLWGAVFGISMALGPLLGGLLVQHVGWRSVFWVNVPIAAIAIVMTAKFVPESRATKPRRIDPVGQMLIVIILGALTTSLIEGPLAGWTSPGILAAIAAVVIGMIVLVAYERRRFEPLIDLRFFKSLPFAIATLLAVVSFASFNGTLFLSSLYLQTTRGLVASHAGLCMLPIAVALAICSPLSGRLVGGNHVRLALVISGCALMMAALLTVQLDLATPLAQLVATFGVFGISIGLINAPITNAAVSGMPRAQAGVASALASTSRQVGATLGIALSGSIVGVAADDPRFSRATHPVLVDRARRWCGDRRARCDRDQRACPGECAECRVARRGIVHFEIHNNRQSLVVYSAAMLRALVVASLCCACGSDPGVPFDLTVEQPGGWGVGTTRFMVTDATTSRTLVEQAWFPTPAAVTAADITTLEAAPLDAQYTQLLAAAPSCPSRTLPVAVDGPVGTGTFPLVLISHCHSCTRLSNATTAIRLASHGFVVVSVEHAGDTLWEHLAGHDANLDSGELEVRAQDVRATLDAVVAGTTPISGMADLAHVGVLGHSFGAVTAGRVAQLDTRITAAAALCAPMENPLTPGVTLAEIHVPLMFVVAIEDNSITEFGNKFIRDNFTAATTAATKIEIPDAGHWSVSDLDGLVDIFAPGCGEAMRQTDGSDFTYLDPPTGRNIAASYATAFFSATLLDDAGAASYLRSASPSFGALDVQHHD